MIKRYLSFLTSFVFIISSLCIAYATDDFQTIEKMDNVQISTRAESIAETGQLSSTRATLYNQEQDIELAVKMYETPEKLMYYDPITTAGTYTKEFAVLVESDQIIPRSSSDISSEEWDKSQGVKGYITITYDRIGTTYKITKTSGCWTNYDAPGTSLSNRWYYVACYDFINVGESEQYIQFNTSSNSFSKNTGFTKYADRTSGMCAIQSNSFVTLTRAQSGETWTLITPCVIANNLPGPASTNS